LKANDCHGGGVLSEKDEAIIHAIKQKPISKPGGQRYSKWQKLIGLGALNISKKCHTFIASNIMPLPSVTSLQKTIGVVMKQV
jgi:hypothetical protein